MKRSFSDNNVRAVIKLHFWKWGNTVGLNSIRGVRDPKKHTGLVKSV